jgi:hypothetical protein
MAVRKSIAGILALGAAAALPHAAPAASPPRGACLAFPRADAEHALGVKTFGADAFDDRLGRYRRRLCRVQTEPGETIELTVWSRGDGRRFGRLPARADHCDVGCLAAGREPNLYRYRQARLGAALCVVRTPRADRDLDTGPITACSISGRRRIMLQVTRKRGLAPAPMATVKALLDRAAAALR